MGSERKKCTSAEMTPPGSSTKSVNQKADIANTRRSGPSASRGWMQVAVMVAGGQLPVILLIIAIKGRNMLMTRKAMARTTAPRNTAAMGSTEYSAISVR